MAAIPSFVRRLVISAIAAAALCALVGTADRVTVWSDASATLHAQTAQAGPRRIVSLVPATTEMLYLIGAGSRLAGVSNYDHFPADVEKLPRVGGLLDPNVETLLSLKPDLVIVYDTQDELKQQLERARIPIFHYVHKGLPDITQTIRLLGERIGSTAIPAALAQLIQALPTICRGGFALNTQNSSQARMAVLMFAMFGLRAIGYPMESGSPSALDDQPGGAWQGDK